MGTNVSYGAVFSGEYVAPYGFAIQKKEHETLLKHIVGERCEDKFFGCMGCEAWRRFDEYWELVEYMQEETK